MSGVSLPATAPGETVPCRSVLIDARPIEHLDEDWAVPCERAISAALVYPDGRTEPDPGHCGGIRPAEWMLWVACGCAPIYRLYCTPCRDSALSWEEIRCPGCLTAWKPGRLAYRLIEPLNRRTP